MTNPCPSLTILGAGPGDPDLITLKGLKALQQADVILYDALTSPLLLEHARPLCKRVHVGKRKGKKEFSQEEINQLIVFYAMRNEAVVRLKGGDPNVFGRGHEEMEYAVKRGVTVQVIPGISSAMGAPAAAGIPLTKRGVNESFWVVTGTLSSGEISNDMHLAAKSSATVIVLMGMTHLCEIASMFQFARSSAEPIAVIQHATLPEQKIIIGTVLDIVQLAKEHKVSSPAVIVIGNVVNERAVVQSLIHAKITQTI